MKKILFLLFIPAVLLVGACEKGSASANAVEIRIKNVSTYDYTNIFVNTSGGTHNYDNLSANQSSDYKTFELAYRYAYIQLKIDGSLYAIQPIDYVGETILSSGNYTYEVDAADSGGQYDRLSLTLVED